VTPDRRFHFRDALLLLLAVFLFLGFCSLGTWQLYRRAWKLDLIAHVEQQLEQVPVAAPGREAWPSLGTVQAYLPVTVSGRFLHHREALVQAMTRYGSGYWLLTPLRTDQGFLVLINRGFVDPDHRDPATRREAQPEGAVEISGLLRLSEPGGRLLQANDPGNDRWYSRDVSAIGAARGLETQNLAPYFIDAGDAPNPGGWPVGALTVVQFRNTHLGYALTWYALALMTALGTWRVLRERTVPAPVRAVGVVERRSQR
jgi:surfeit locus 1 family protein